MPRKETRELQEPKSELERFDPDDNDVVDGDPAWEFKLDEASMDPGRRYCWPHNDDEDIRRYKALGYRLETFAPDSVHLRGASDGFKDGDAITARDHVLMSCPMDLHERRERARHARGQATFKSKMAEARGAITLRAE